MKISRFIAAASAAFLLASSAALGADGTITSHAFAIGKGPGTQGFTSLLCGSAQIAVGQAAADPICKTIAGDITITAAGVTALGNIPTLTTLAGTILSTNIAAPSTPASGKVSIWTDSTDLRFHDKNSAGTIGTTVVASTAPAHTFANSMSSAGVVGYAQPAIGDISGAGTTRAGDIAYFNGSAWVTLAGNNSGTQVLQENALGVPSWVTVTGTGTVTSATIAAGNGISVSGTCTITTSGTCTVAQSLTNATLQASPTNPAAFTSASFLMAGFGTTCHLTPSYSTRIQVSFNFDFETGTAGVAFNSKVMFGTGTAPANAAAVAGTQVGNIHGPIQQVGADFIPITHGAYIITGLTAGTAYWFDIALQGDGTHGFAIQNVSCSAMEF